MSRSINSRGFTLLEVLGAILVLGLGILALNRTQIATLNTNSFANELSQATKLAQDRMEVLTSLPFDDPGLNDTNDDGTDQDPDFNGTDDFPDNGSLFGLTDTEGAPGADFKQYNGKYSIYSNIANDQPIEGNKTIRVIVQWTDKRNVNHAVVMDGVKGASY